MTQNDAPGTLTIPAGNLQPRNIGSVVTIAIDSGILVGTLEAYSVMPDGKNMDLKLQGTEAVLVPSRLTITLSRSSTYNAHISQALTIQGLLGQLLASVDKAVGLVSESSDAIHDIADILDVPDSPAELAKVTPLVMASA